MTGIEAITLVAAVIGAVVGVLNLWLAWRLAAVRWSVVVRLERGQHGGLELYVDVVNAGRVAVAVEEVFLARPRDHAARSACLSDWRGHPGFPRQLPAGQKFTIGPVHRGTLEAVAVLKPIAVVAKSQDGRTVEARCPGLRQLYDELQAAAAEQAAQ